MKLFSPMKDWIYSLSVHPEVKFAPPPHPPQKKKQKKEKKCPCAVFTVYWNTRSHTEYKQASSFLSFTYYHLSKEDYKGLSQLWFIFWVLRRSPPPPAIHAHCTYIHMLHLGKGSFSGSCLLIAQGMTHGFTTSPHLLSSANSLTSPLSFQLSWGYFVTLSRPGRTDGIMHHHSTAWMSSGPPIWPQLGQKQVPFLLIHHQTTMQKTWCERLCPWSIYVSQCWVSVCYLMWMSLIGPLQGHVCSKHIRTEHWSSLKHTSPFQTV